MLLVTYTAEEHFISKLFYMVNTFVCVWYFLWHFKAVITSPKLESTALTLTCIVSDIIGVVVTVVCVTIESIPIVADIVAIVVIHSTTSYVSIYIPILADTVVAIVVIHSTTSYVSIYIPILADTVVAIACWHFSLICWHVVTLMLCTHRPYFTLPIMAIQHELWYKWETENAIFIKASILINMHYFHLCDASSSKCAHSFMGENIDHYFFILITCLGFHKIIKYLAHFYWWSISSFPCTNTLFNVFFY